MKWIATIDEPIIIEDKGLRSLLKSKDDPGAFADAMCLRFEEELRRQLEAGVPLMVEFAPHRQPVHNKAKKVYGMTGGM